MPAASGSTGSISGTSWTSLALIPSQSYCDALGRSALVYWKFKMYRRFYGAKKNDDEGGFLASLAPALRGLFSSDEHATKLETVVAQRPHQRPRDDHGDLWSALYEQGG